MVRGHSTVFSSADAELEAEVVDDSVVEESSFEQATAVKASDPVVMAVRNFLVSARTRTPLFRLA